MDYMFASGFLGTKAPFFMDFVTITVALLPLLVWLGVKIVQRRLYALHAIYQILIFFVSIVIVGWFEYGVRVGGGFSSFVSGNPRSETLMMIVLAIHIAISVISTLYWARTIWNGYRNYRADNLPGGFSVPHKYQARLALLGIFLTAITGIWVYLMLFVY